MPNDKFREMPWPPLRTAIVGTLRQHRPHTVYGTGEADVTETLVKLKGLQRELGIAVSFHAYVLYCISQAANRHPEVHRYKFRKKFVLFEELDIATVIERRIPGQGRIPVQHIFRGANAKSFALINWELRTTSRSDPTKDPNVQLRRKVARYPGIVRRLIGWKISRNPFWLKKFYGTMGVTNLQRQDFHNVFFALPPNLFTLTLAIGSITDRFLPDTAGQPVLRKVLCVGLGADHAVIDGGDIARFCETFAGLLTAGAGLDDAFMEESRRLLQDSRK